MPQIVGIDLGTTYSVVAIPEERREPGFSVVPGCPGCSIVHDANERRITPSVVAEDSQGRIVVGYSAKARAGLAPEPIMFSKRWMGKDKKFALAKQGTFDPQQAASRLLRYLKEMAEARLKDTVDEAVITVPAYFSLQAKQMTEAAGRDAGLKVAQVAQEPVAAALMYCASDPRPDLRILTYDLGGGTFDVAVLEKRDGVISTDSIRAFDGNPHLGGYNFDQAITWWIVDQLKKRYGFDLNVSDPADQVRFAKLMIYAERAKVALSQADACDIQDPACSLQDRSGADIVLDLRLTRSEFEDMIKKDIDETMELCDRALEKCSPSLRHDEIDEICLVGGSARIPMVIHRLEEKFGKKPRLTEPDLAVALGAALLAKSLRGASFGCLKLDPIPLETDLPSLTISGTVIADKTLPTVAGSSVALRALDGSFNQRRSVQADGRFAFADVPLARATVRKFALTVTASQGAEVVNHRFEVRQGAGVRGGLIEAVTNVLSKPISLVMVAGLQVIAPERTPLPFQTVIHAKTTDDSGVIRVPIQDENTPLGEVRIQYDPAQLPVGSAVEVTVIIHANYQITGRAFVPSLKLEEKVDIFIPVVKLASRDDLLGRHADLARRAQAAIDGSDKATVIAKPKKINRLKQLLADSKEKLQGRAPDLAGIAEMFNEIENLIRVLSAGWKPDPPRAIFEQRCDDAADRIKEVRRHRADVIQQYEDRLAALKTEAAGAEASQNPAAWKEAYQNVGKLCKELEEFLPRDKEADGPKGAPQPGVILMNLAEALKNLADLARRRGMYDRLSRQFDEAKDALAKIKAQAPDAMNQISDWYFTRYKTLEKLLDAPTPTGLLDLEKKPDASSL